jgi:signal transduction histidine kinase
MPAVILMMAGLTFVIGAVVLWINSRRFINQVFALASLTSTAWLYFFFSAQRAGESYLHSATINPVPWLKATSAAGAFFPWIIWLFMQSILTAEGQSTKTLRRSWPWLMIGTILAALCFTELFIPSDSTPDHPKRGIGYLVYISISVILYIFLIFQSYRHLKREQGVRRIELQFLTFNSGLSCLLAIALTFVGSYFNIRFLSRLSPITIVIFYALTAWAITVHRIFDARQIFLSIVQRLVLVIILTLGIFCGWWLFSFILLPPGDMILSVAICTAFTFLLERTTREWFGISPEQNIAATRRAVIDLARKEPSPEILVVEFENLLRAWGQTDYARLLFDSGEVYAAGDRGFAKGRPAHAALCKAGWSTPESLQRQRPETGLIDLRQYLKEYSLGLIVTAPRSSPNPSLLLTLGTKANHRPFTYPEVQQAQEIAEFMDNILARSRLTLQARQSEQLATIGLLGASLAHEIRNPLVSIKTFAHLLPSRFDDPDFRRRFNLLIPSEVDRIENLTQQLLDLSNPRRHQMERISLHQAVREAIDLMQIRVQEAKASITLTLDAKDDTIWADSGAIRQVLINLFINAFQAIEFQESNRLIEVCSRSAIGGSIILEVSDNGPGIPPDQRARLFHPFVSTKTKGMGLGLAVCADILHEHHATIIVPDIGRPGATFRITFPCPPPSS